MGEWHLRGCNSPGRVAPSEAPVAPSGVRVAPRPGATRTFQVASGLSEMCDSHVSDVRVAHFSCESHILGSEWSSEMCDSHLCHGEWHLSASRVAHFRGRVATGSHGARLRFQAAGARNRQGGDVAAVGGPLRGCAGQQILFVEVLGQQEAQRRRRTRTRRCRRPPTRTSSRQAPTPPATPLTRTPAAPTVRACESVAVARLLLTSCATARTTTASQTRNSQRMRNSHSRCDGP